MHRRPFPHRRHVRAPLAGLLAATAALVLIAATGAVAAKQAPKPKLKLPAERTSPTGNFFTLKAYSAPTASNPVANFEMKVCTSKHTPSYTAIEPAFFTLALVHGGTVTESIAAAKHPAIVPKPLKPLECTEGWLGFRIPKGKSPATLEYQYNGKISWSVG